MLHLAISLATCVAAKLRDKLRDKLHSVTAPLVSQPTIAIYPRLSGNIPETEIQKYKFTKPDTSPPRNASPAPVASVTFDTRIVGTSTSCRETKTTQYSRYKNRSENLLVASTKLFLLRILSMEVEQYSVKKHQDPQFIMFPKLTWFSVAKMEESSPHVTATSFEPHASLITLVNSTMLFTLHTKSMLNLHARSQSYTHYGIDKSGNVRLLCFRS